MKALYLLFLVLFVACGKSPNNTVSPRTKYSSLRWDKSRLPLTIYIPIEYQDNFKGTAVQEVVQEINSAVPYDMLIVKYKDLSLNDYSCTSCDPNLVKNAYLNDNIITISEPQHFLPNSNGDALGTTVFKYSSTYNYLIQADILLNTEHYSLVDTGTTPQDNQADFRTVVLHELGHLIGLNHPAAGVDPDSVMNPSITSSKVINELSEGDIERIQEKYFDL